MARRLTKRFPARRLLICRCVGVEEAVFRLADEEEDEGRRRTTARRLRNAMNEQIHNPRVCPSSYLLGPTNPCLIAVHMEPFSTSLPPCLPSLSPSSLLPRRRMPVLFAVLISVFCAVSLVAQISSASAGGAQRREHSLSPSKTTPNS
eukprot:3418544-Rhodomonas_salina.2